MTDKELSRLKRVDLLELLIAQIRETDQLREELVRVKEQLAAREIELGRAGSIAEAALKLNGVFQAAQEAADQYMRSLLAQGEKQRRRWIEIEKEAHAEAEALLAQTRAKCRELEERAQRRQET